MTGIQQIQECPGLRPTHIAHDDAIWAVTKDRLEQIIKGNIASVCVELRLGGDEVRLRDTQFRHVFDEQDALFLGDRMASTPVAST